MKKIKETSDAQLLSLYLEGRDLLRTTAPLTNNEAAHIQDMQFEILNRMQIGRENVPENRLL